MKSSAYLPSSYPPITAIVPMKEYSERIEKKNLVDLGGKPLYRHILDNLLASIYIQEIIIDTDSPTLTDLIRSTYSDAIHIIPRPTSLWGDFVSMNTIIEHDITKTTADYFLQTHVTNPLLKTETINHAIELFFANINQYALHGNINLRLKKARKNFLKMMVES